MGQGGRLSGAKTEVGADLAEPGPAVGGDFILSDGVPHMVLSGDSYKQRVTVVDSSSVSVPRPPLCSDPLTLLTLTASAFLLAGGRAQGAGAGAGRQPRWGPLSLRWHCGARYRAYPVIPAPSGLSRLVLSAAEDLQPHLRVSVRFPRSAR